MIRLPSSSSSSRARTVIYADNAATTIIRPSALAKYNSACKSAFGNPSSLHSAGKVAHEMLEWARGVHARYMNVPPGCIYFTSCGTESNNIAIRGVLTKARRTNGRNVVITSSVEHSSVRKTAELAAGPGGHVMVPVDTRGYVDEQQFADILRGNAPQVALISIILAQNEVGTLQRIPALVKIAKSIVPDVVFHTDATQAFGKYFINPELLGVDLLTASAHKYHGPRGVGILYARAGVLDPDALPITGGGQERGCKSGTENVPAIAAAAVALDHMLADEGAWVERKAAVRAMRDLVIQGIVDGVPGTTANGDPARGLYGLASLTLPRGIRGADVARILDAGGICIGSGSACSKGRPSESMLAMGKTPEQASRVVRISLSEFNTVRECQEIVAAVVRACRRI